MHTSYKGKLHGKTQQLTPVLRMMWLRGHGYGPSVTLCQELTYLIISSLLIYLWSREFQIDFISKRTEALKIKVIVPGCSEWGVWLRFKTSPDIWSHDSHSVSYLTLATQGGERTNLKNILARIILCRIDLSCVFLFSISRKVVFLFSGLWTKWLSGIWVLFIFFPHQELNV